MSKKLSFCQVCIHRGRVTVCKLKYNKKLSVRNGSLENLIEEPLLLRPRSTVRA